MISNRFPLGLIHYGIVIHGFIHGYSHLITGLRASNNNSAQTVLDLFLDAVMQYVFLLISGATMAQKT